MTPLKFRAWDKLKKEMDTDGFYRLGRFFDLHDSAGTDSVIMQSTGLTDQNGVEIYEGDVVLTEKDEIGEIKYGKFMSSHEAGCSRGHWHIGFYVERNGSQLWDSCGEDLDLDKLKVIGNVWQNSDLLSPLV
jgi:uncharacterized phage protein (TIGR01671 family)